LPQIGTSERIRSSFRRIRWSLIRSIVTIVNEGSR